MSKRLFLLHVAFLIVSSLVAESTVVQSQSGATIAQASTDDSIPELIAPEVNLSVVSWEYTKGNNDGGVFEAKVEGSIVNPNALPVYNVKIHLKFDITQWRTLVPLAFYSENETISIGTMASHQSINIDQKTYRFGVIDWSSLELRQFLYYVEWDEPVNSSPEQTPEPPSDASTDSEIIVHKPSVPEFTVNLVAYPYDVPATYGIDQFTGENVTIQEGYHVENRSIEIVIKNQPFTPYNVSDVTEINLYYNVRAKGHFGDKWEVLYSEYKDSSSAYPVQSSSEYTVLSLPADYPDGAKVDFQVEAITGYYKFYPASIYWYNFYELESVESSGWSNTQTLTIDWNDTIIFGEPTATNDESFQIEHLGIAATVMSAAALAIGLLVYFKIRKH